jgi:hypothetical protein
MPYRILNRQNGYAVINPITGRVYAKNTANPMSVIRAVEFGKSLSTHPKLKNQRDQQHWVNLTARLTDPEREYKCGTRGPKQNALHLPSVCRPRFRSKNSRMVLADTLSDSQIRKAVKIKQQGARIRWSDL